MQPQSIQLQCNILGKNTAVYSSPGDSQQKVLAAVASAGIPPFYGRVRKNVTGAYIYIAVRSKEVKVCFSANYLFSTSFCLSFFGPD